MPTIHIPDEAVDIVATALEQAAEQRTRVALKGSGAVVTAGGDIRTQSVRIVKLLAEANSLRETADAIRNPPSIGELSVRAMIDKSHAKDGAIAALVAEGVLGDTRTDAEHEFDTIAEAQEKGTPVAEVVPPAVVDRSLCQHEAHTGSDAGLRTCDDCGVILPWSWTGPDGMAS